MREIEIKCRVQSPEDLLHKLEAHNIMLQKPLIQHDVVYGPHGAKADSTGTNWLRIRTQDNKTIFFTLKQTLSTNGDSLEHELEVSDAKELEAIIHLLGYELYSDLTKIRRKAHAGDLEICFDEVPDLGTFIEVESLEAHDADPQKVRQQLWEFLRQFGLDEGDEIHAGYDILMNQHLAAQAERQS